MSEVIDRKVMPLSGMIKNIAFEFPDSTNLDNDTKVYVYSDKEAEVIRIEFQYNAGTAYNEKRLQASFTNKLIISGTSSMSEKEIVEKIDFYGAYFENHIGADEASFVIYTLKKYAVEVLEIVAEVLNDPVFPESELDTMRLIRKQKFLVQSEKVNFLARQAFAKNLYGQNHPYGGVTELHHYDDLTQNDLIEFHRDHYQKKPTIIVAGNTSGDIVKHLNRLFGQPTLVDAKGLASNQDISPGKKSILIEKEGAVQSALRIGRHMFNRNHRDFPEMHVLVTVFAGYFGSRLMSNLREDKGYTYGIGGGIASLLKSGYFFISGEVGADVRKLAEKEIFFEMKKIREELIPNHELDLVKNYLLGQILKSTDGVFARANRFKVLNLYGQNIEDFYSMIEKIRSVKSVQLQQMANQWLVEDEMHTIVAGK